MFRAYQTRPLPSPPTRLVAPPLRFAFLQDGSLQLDSRYGCTEPFLSTPDDARDAMDTCGVFYYLSTSYSETSTIASVKIGEQASDKTTSPIYIYICVWCFACCGFLCFLSPSTERCRQSNPTVDTVAVLILPIKRIIGDRNKNSFERVPVPGMSMTARGSNEPHF